MNKIYKAAVIGCGKIGVEIGNYKKEVQPATHAGAYNFHPKIQLSALADIDEKRLKIAAKYFPKVSLFKSTESLLKEIKPDIVSIATSSDSHSKLVKLVAKYKTKAIICEKPIALSLKDAEEMIRVCKNSKSLLFINHHRRFDPLIRDWQGKVKKGLIGDIFQGSCYYYNGLFNNGTHTIDLLRFFLGEVDWVRGFENLKTSSLKDDKNIDGIICFKNGAKIFLQSLLQNYGFANYYFYGTRGRLAIKNFGYEIEHRKLIKNKYYKGYYQLSDNIEQVGKLRSFMGAMTNHVIDCLENKDYPVSRGEDGLAALKIIFAFKESVKNNSKTIKI